jgi:hypothetical protein
MYNFTLEILLLTAVASFVLLQAVQLILDVNTFTLVILVAEDIMTLAFNHEILFDPHAILIVDHVSVLVIDPMIDGATGKISNPILDILLYVLNSEYQLL